MTDTAGGADLSVRPYDPATDRSALWELKRSFEHRLGDGKDSDAKAEAYAAKLDEDYRERYLDWVERCVADDPRCCSVAEAGGRLVGYVFVLPERLSMVWDAAVLNEIYVVEAYRGGPVANELMTAAVALARSQDLPMDRLVLDVDTDNDRAKGFYRRHGFEPWGEMLARDL